MATPAAEAGSPPVRVTTTPGLYPAFSTAVSDYVIRCAQTPKVGVTVSAPPGVAVTVGSQQAHTGTFKVAVAMAPGQSIPIRVQGGGRTDEYFARCLPADFPAWGTVHLGAAQSGYYLTIPQNGQAGPRYAVIFDPDGVPLWWAPAPGGWYATLLSGNRVGWTDGSGAVVENLDGTGSVRVTTPGASPDFHELGQLPDGDYLLVADRPTPPVNLSAVGGPDVGVLLDNVIEEITPTGKLAWSWSAAAHIGLTELEPEWVAQAAPGGAPLDVFHMNSVAPDGNGLVVSFRHLDAVYRIDKATGAVTWKLGGTTTAQSLQVLGDPVFATPGGGFSGQHDARILPDHTLTVYDNGTNHRPPRAVRYVIDLGRRTATLVEDLTDPQATASLCCGSARRLSGGDWVVSWGYTPYTEEVNAHGHVVVRLQWAPGYFSYRADAIPAGSLSRQQLRAAMDARAARHP